MLSLDLITSKLEGNKSLLETTGFSGCFGATSTIGSISGAPFRMAYSIVVTGAFVRFFEIPDNSFLTYGSSPNIPSRKGFG